MTHLQDLPEAVLREVFTMVGDVRTRNAMSLVCRKCLSLERATRTTLALRGNVRDLYLLPLSFSLVTDLDLSLLSPWGHPFLHPLVEEEDDHVFVMAQRLRQAFPEVEALTHYARHPATLSALAAQWPRLRRAKLVRWHARPHGDPLGADLAPLLESCRRLTSLDLSAFYCWPEDVPHALRAHSEVAAKLTHLDLLCPSWPEGFRSPDLLLVASACGSLRRLLALVIFNPHYIGFIDDDTLLALAASCPNLTLLHLADPEVLSSSGNNTCSTADGFAPEDSRISAAGLMKLFSNLPLLDHFAMEMCHNVREAGGAIQALSSKIKHLKVVCFHGVCPAAGLHLDGIAVCGGLLELCISNSADLTDSGIVAIARGCRRLKKFELVGCRRVTEIGMKRMACIIRSTLIDVRISSCELLDAASSLQALEPIRATIQYLHIDCIWVKNSVQPLAESHTLIDEEFEDNSDDDDDTLEGRKNKKPRYSYEPNNNSCFWLKTWNSLRFLSLWLPVGELLTPLPDAGLEDCPELEEVHIKVEGDCRACPKPNQIEFGLSTLVRYPSLSKMKLFCMDLVGYALTAPTGLMDLSLWERFYLHGIGNLLLYELDYWPPQDKDVNLRPLSLPAASLLQGCSTLRKLFIHGTAHEHFMRFFLNMPNLRDVQLRADYYPAPENDMSTEMRMNSCRRFQDLLNRNTIPD